MNLIAVGDMVRLPSFGPGHPLHHVDRQITGTPGRVDSITSDGWAMVDRGGWGTFGCHVDKLELANGEPMIKAAGRTADGRPLLVLGLSGENMTRLMADEPITFDLSELGLPPMQVLIVGGRTEDAITTQLIDAGLLQKGDTIQ